MGLGLFLGAGYISPRATGPQGQTLGLRGNSALGWKSGVQGPGEVREECWQEVW